MAGIRTQPDADLHHLKPTGLDLVKGLAGFDQHGRDAGEGRKPGAGDVDVSGHEFAGVHDALFIWLAMIVVPDPLKGS